MLKLLSGSWESDRIEHLCVGPECCRSKEDCIAKITGIVMAAMAAVPPRAFPKSRWTGGLASIWVGFVAAHDTQLVADDLQAVGFNQARWEEVGCDRVFAQRWSWI